MSNLPAPSDVYPALPASVYDVYACRDFEWLGEFYVPRPGQPADEPVSMGESLMWHNRGSGEVRIFNTYRLNKKLDWSLMLACVDDKASVEETCLKLHASRRCIIEYWMSKAARPSIDFFRSDKQSPLAADVTEFVRLAVKRRDEVWKHYPHAKMGHDNPVFDGAHFDTIAMLYHPPVERFGDDAQETRLRPPSQYALPTYSGKPDKYLGQTLHYQHLAIGVLMHEQRCTFKEGIQLWWQNANNILPAHDHDPVHDATNILLNYADIVLGACNVQKLDPNFDVHSPAALIAIRARGVSQ